MNTTQLSLIAATVGRAEPSMSDVKIAIGIWVVQEEIERCFVGDLSEKWRLGGISPKVVQDFNLEAVEVRELNLKTNKPKQKSKFESKSGTSLKFVQVLNLRQVQVL
jgi:hypothetical protein